MEGAVPNHFYVELNCPELLKAKLGTTKVLWQLGELSMVEIQHVGRVDILRRAECSQSFHRWPELRAAEQC